MFGSPTGESCLTTPHTQLQRGGGQQESGGRSGVIFPSDDLQTNAAQESWLFSDPRWMTSPRSQRCCPRVGCRWKEGEDSLSAPTERSRASLFTSAWRSGSPAASASAAPPEQLKHVYFVTVLPAWSPPGARLFKTDWHSKRNFTNVCA